MWCKHTNYEQATRIPLIIVAPSVTSGATVSRSLVESVDIFPTLCELAGLTVPTGLDGIAFTPVLKDPDSSTKEAIFHVYPRGKRLGRAVRTSRYRLVEWKELAAEPADSEYELYDYETDPAETRNLAGERTEVLRELQAVLAKQPAPLPQIDSATTDATK
jgi:iduronate 2-sulfatase